MHKTAQVKAKLAELNIRVIWGVPYNPEYNGIELYFAQLKRIYKKKMLQTALNEEPLLIKPIVNEVLEEVDNNIACACAMEGMTRILKVNLS